MAIKNDQYNQILREYDYRQQRNKHDLDRRRENAFRTIPELKTLEDDMISLAVQSGKMAILGDDTKLRELQAQTLHLKAKQIELLLSNGFADDYLELRYTCNLCKDTGWVENQKCGCLKQAIADLIYDDSNIKSVLVQENFQSFSFQYYSDDYIDESIGLSPLSNMQKIVAYSKNFIRHFNDSFDNLLFMGNCGVGKTFLVNCIAKELLDQGETVIYLTAFRLFDILEKYKFKKEQDVNKKASGQYDYIHECDLLIIDDLGTELNNSFTTSQLYFIINERLLKQKSTIISTNLSLDNINKNYGERIFSRIISNYSIQRIIGEDIRLHKAVHN